MMTTASGCATGPSDSALAAVLDKPLTECAAVFAEDDTPAMRACGRSIIATYDAATLRS